MKEINMEVVRKLQETVAQADEIIERNNQSATKLCMQYYRALFSASEAVGEAMELHRGLVCLLQMARAAIEDGMLMESCVPLALLDIASSIEMRLDSAMITMEAARGNAA